jgi:type I restriction enzyme S subunit
MSSSNTLLPLGWVSADLGDLVELNPRFDPAQTGGVESVSFVPMAAVEAGTGQMDATVERPWDEVRKGYTPFREGDVLFAKITPCMENGKAAVATGLINGLGAGSTEFHVLRPLGGVESKFILYFVLQEDFRRLAQSKMRGAAGQLRVPKEFMQTASLPVPPLPEQRRIVVEIETQFTRLDAAMTVLERARANLKRYRAAVLAAAATGTLLLKERGECSEILGSDEPWSIPVRWQWSTVGRVAGPEKGSITDGPFGSNLKTEHYTSSGPRVVRLQNIGDGVFVDESAHISESHYETLRKHEVRDLLEPV